MTKLSDLQLVLLSTAAQRGDGSLLPPASSVTAKLSRVHQAVATLVSRGLAVDVPAATESLAYRCDDGWQFGATITDAGRAAVGIESQPANFVAPPAPMEANEAPPATKSAQVMALLRRDDGASLDELVAATGWLPHTTRAALTGLRKKGHAIIRTGKTGARRYHIAA